MGLNVSFFLGGEATLCEIHKRKLAVSALAQSTLKMLLGDKGHSLLWIILLKLQLSLMITLFIMPHNCLLC